MMRPPRGVLRLHYPESFLSAEERARQIDIDDGLPLFESDIFQGDSEQSDSGVVEQHIKPSERFPGFGKECMNGHGIAYIVESARQWRAFSSVQRPLHRTREWFFRAPQPPSGKDDRITFP